MSEHCITSTKAATNCDLESLMSVLPILLVIALSNSSKLLSLRSLLLEEEEEQKVAGSMEEEVDCCRDTSIATAARAVANKINYQQSTQRAFLMNESFNIPSLPSFLRSPSSRLASPVVSEVLGAFQELNMGTQGQEPRIGAGLCWHRLQLSSFHGDSRSCRR